MRPHEMTPGDPALGALELWGGHECTVNRVGDQWFDQTIRNGHQHRPDDLAMFAGLGLRALRYPVLWERIAPDHPELRDFTWTDERLPMIRDLGMRPIVTLCHHGSGPRYTSLLDDGYAPGLARHAAAVAERYPWIEEWTPVNEPLTTARFSTLYGFWYPHACDERLLWQALLNETEATQAAMRAIRRVNPAARLIQTDDLGYCHASPALQAEADFQNDRRWLGWDLLCGTVVPGHAMWERLCYFDLGDRLRAIADAPCPPDVIGVNHYLSSERLLDERIEQHGARGLADSHVGNNNGVAHVDVDAVRNAPDRVIGLSGLIEQAWKRYRIPVAVTECHNGSTREEQARWFVETWDAAEALRTRGVDVRAVTAWALLGSHDWNRMVTSCSGHYEPGVFDVRSDPPRPTLMARVLTDLAGGRRPEGPALTTPGWWRQERRALWGQSPAFALDPGPRAHPAPPPLAILAGDALLTRLATDACEARGLHYLLIKRGHETRLRTARPWAVLDARGPATPGDRAHDDLAEWCRSLSITGAIVLADRPAADGPAGLLIASTGPIYTAGDDAGVEARLFDAIEAGLPAAASDEQAWDGVFGPALIDGLLDLLLDGAVGRFAFRPATGTSTADLARVMARVAGRDVDLIANQAPMAQVSPAPSACTMSYLPSLDSIMERYVSDRRRFLAIRAAAPVVSVALAG